MRSFFKSAVRLVCGMALAGLAAPAAAQVSITALGTPVSENFDTLASSGTSSTVPTGLGVQRSRFEREHDLYRRHRSRHGGHLQLRRSRQR